LGFGEGWSDKGKLAIEKKNRTHATYFAGAGCFCGFRREALPLVPHAPGPPHGCPWGVEKTDPFKQAMGVGGDVMGDGHQLTGGMGFCWEKPRGRIFPRGEKKICPKGVNKKQKKGKWGGE